MFVDKRKTVFSSAKSEWHYSS